MAAVTAAPSTASPALSVVLPTHNGARTIGVQLDALARQQSSRPWELVVCDNGSTDDTVEIVDRYSSRVPSLRVVDASAKPGSPFAANAGVAAAAGASIVFVSDDDEVADGWLEALGDALEEHELVTGRLEHHKLNEPWAVAVRGEPQTDGLPHWSMGTHLPFGFGCALGVSRTVHEAIGGFDEEMVPAGEDVDYCWRAQYAGARLRFIPEAVTHYRVRSDWAGIYGQARNYGIGDVLLYKKHRGLGLPETSRRLSAAAKVWLGIIRQSLLVSGKARRGVFLWQLGWRVGRLQASVRHRVLLP